MNIMPVIEKPTFKRNLFIFHFLKIQVNLQHTSKLWQTKLMLGVKRKNTQYRENMLWTKSVYLNLYCRGLFRQSGAGNPPHQDVKDVIWSHTEFKSLYHVCLLCQKNFVTASPTSILNYSSLLLVAWLVYCFIGLYGSSSQYVDYSATFRDKKGLWHKNNNKTTTDYLILLGAGDPWH